MKKKELLRIFGTENPLLEEYQEWIVQNNPKTFYLWIPPLNSQEKSIFSHSELVRIPSNLIENIQWDSYPKKWLPIEFATLIISHVREINKENLSGEKLFLLLYELEKCLSDYKIRLVYGSLYNQTLHVLEKHGISVNRVINSSKKNIWEKKDELFSDLSKWSIGDDSITKIDSLIGINKNWILGITNDNDYESLRNTIIQTKFEEIKKNPQNWKISKTSKINLPWSGGSDYIERKDGKEKLYKSYFNQQQWKEIEKSLGNNFFLIIIVILLMILFFIFFRWYYNKKNKVRND